METLLCLWLPGLAGTGALPASARWTLPGVYRLWPGLPDRLAADSLDQAWTPPDLPLSQAEMGAFAADLERFAGDLTRGGSGLGEAFLASARESREAEVARDLDAIRALAGPDPGLAARRLRLLRERAQRLLAWYWFQQKTLAEIAVLVDRINAGVEGLGEGLSRDVDGTPVLETGPLPLGADLSPEGLSGGSLMVLLEAALALTGPETVFVLEEGALSEEEEGCPLRSDFAPEPGFAGALDAVLAEGALGLERPAGELLPGSVWLPDPGRPVRLLLSGGRA